MATKTVTKRELLDRWRGIEEYDEDGDNDDHNVSASNPYRFHRLRLLKEEWFAEAFNYLVYIPKQNHIWCGSWDLMGPLLETFYNYFEDKRHDSPLKLLWKRISEETQRCTQCICQHHQAQEMYNSEYELSSIGPLLDVLRTLDEERVTQHLKEINSKITRGEYDPGNDGTEVVSVMFEVLMFPTLLDDQSLVTEFQIFIEAIDDSHELALAGHQQYPGVYALFFLKSRRSRSIGLRLAVNMGKLRRATDLEPMQPLLQKCVGLLESEVLPLAIETSRPRVELERTTVWLGIKALLGFLEPPAFEEGILERYPVFLSIILNHISDDSGEFSYAVNCLRLLLEMLGCKLWLRATLSPSVMRNTLLGQCFHTRNEKIHKEIYDLFRPFLHSLEALQDGEHEKQRRHFLYFLLYQVPFSSNFSILMRKKACQIALLIIHRGYKMIPPCPAFECAHMWGPSLVSSLKDSSLHSSLRQPAFDLIQTIIVSDAAALASSMLNCRTPPNISKGMSSELSGEDEDESFLFIHDVEEKDDSCWNEFTVQSRSTSQEFREWMCIPMLWIDVLLEIDPVVLPVSFSKAVFWALSHLSMIEPESNTEMALPVRNWLSTCASEISHLYGWKVPSGSDDGGDGKDSKNSIKVSTMCISLLKTFKRLTACFSVKMEQGELRKQWTWEPRMSESLILLLVDPNDNARQVGRRILEQVSNTRGLAHGLQFLCSCSSSLSAVLFGLKHASKLVQMDSVLLNFQSLHHFFFVLCKLLVEGVTSTPTLPWNSSDELNISKFSSQGGFLRQPLFDSVQKNVGMHLVTVDLLVWEEFSHLLAEIIWPFIRKCLEEGKAYIDYKISQVERHQRDYQKRSSIIVIRFYLQNGSSRLNRARKLLIERSKWYVARIMSMTSQLREFQALSSINAISLLPIILNPVNHSFGHDESRKGDVSKLPHPLQRILKSSYNDSQLHAIGAAIEPLDSKDYEMSLIQGPPGTGKTRTILAIVSGLLAFHFQRRNDRKKPVNENLKLSHNLCSNLKPQICQSAATAARAWQDAAALTRQLDANVEENSKSVVGSCTRGRVLICAQSNAAVDELVSRISSEGIYGNDGEKYKPYLVRVGNPKTVHPNSLPFFIDTLVDHMLAAAEERTIAKSDTAFNSSTGLRANLEKLVDRIRFYETKRANSRDGNSNSKNLSKGNASEGGNDGKEMSEAEIDAKLRRLYAEKKAMYVDLSSAQAKEKRANDESKALKHKFRRSILREAEIVVATLSGCGGDVYVACSESISNHRFSNPSEHALFDAVVIDEAAQALEPATLIPLQLLKSQGTMCIMVGDPKQLPATVLSNVASKYLYQCSMFERLQRAGHPVIMLTEQYRMHPEICRFPSWHFYDKKLVNGNQMSCKSAPFHETEGLGPYLFFDVVDGLELHGKNSLYNECEADAAVEVVRYFKNKHPSEFVGGRIGVITPYRSQLSLLHSRFSTAFGPSVASEIEFNTVDGFQGREVDILLLSTVRAAETCSAAAAAAAAAKINSSNIGFVADIRRMNVSLTRARLSLWILGNARTLQMNHNWGALLRDAKKRNLVVSVEKPYQSLFKSNSNKSSRDERKHDDVSRGGSKQKTGNSKTKKRARDDPVKKDHPRSVAGTSREGSGSNCMQSEILTDKERGVGNDLLKSSKGFAKSSKLKMKMGPSYETKVHGRDGTTGASNQASTPKDAIAERKQQRDAVEALLSSAFIPSKKAHTSLRSLPVKRPISPKSPAGGGI